MPSLPPKVWLEQLKWHEWLELRVQRVLLKKIVIKAVFTKLPETPAGGHPFLLCCHRPQHYVVYIGLWNFPHTTLLPHPWSNTQSQRTATVRQLKVLNCWFHFKTLSMQKNKNKTQRGRWTSLNPYQWNYIKAKFLYWTQVGHSDEINLRIFTHHCDQPSIYLLSFPLLLSP